MKIVVPDDFQTLEEAVDSVRGDDRLTTIVVRKGTYNVGTPPRFGGVLSIRFPMTIIGEGKVVINGGLDIEIPQGDVHIQNVILCQSQGVGVGFYHLPYGVRGLGHLSLENVTVQKAFGFGGIVVDNIDTTCEFTNVKVLECLGEGLALSNASVTLKGAATEIFNNNFGVIVDYRSQLELEYPLTKEKVFYHNGRFSGGVFSGLSTLIGNAAGHPNTNWNESEVGQIRVIRQPSGQSTGGNQSSKLRF
jgi:hypothetical protein